MGWVGLECRRAIVAVVGSMWWLIAEHCQKTYRRLVGKESSDSFGRKIKDEELGEY